MALSWFRAQALASSVIFMSAHALQLPNYVGLKTSLNNNVLDITFHNPTSDTNLWNQDTQDSLTDLVGRLQHDNETKVVVFKSDIPRYFIAHADLTQPSLFLSAPDFGELLFNISSLPQVTIGAVEGRARGAGNELLVSLDMRFATKNDTLFGQPEVANGLIPGGGGSQYLTGLIGRGLAMEYILSSQDINATEAEKIGWINKAFDTTADMDAYINNLTSRLRLFPQSALAKAKQSINLRSAPSLQDISHDANEFILQASEPIVQEIGAKVQALYQNKTAAEVELDLGALLPTAYV